MIFYKLFLISEIYLLKKVTLSFYVRKSIIIGVLEKVLIVMEFFLCLMSKYVFYCFNIKILIT